MNREKDIRKIVAKGSFENELEFQRALIMDRKLRLMINDNPELRPLREKLKLIIKTYEDKNWSSYQGINQEQLTESDKAEQLAEAERIFHSNRKNSIKKRLKELNMTQQDLGLVLGHGKSYMSELMNGISPFSMKDLVIIHHLLKINFKVLIPVILKIEETKRIKSSISKLDNPKLKFDIEDLETF